MAIVELTAAQARALAGARHAETGVLYPEEGMQPYYLWLVRSIHALASASAGSLRVAPDDATPTSARVAPGRATLQRASLAFEGSTIDLAAFNNAVAYVWLYDHSGAAAIGVGASGDGWPITPHVPLAEVTLANGSVQSILDRRFDTVLLSRRADADADTPMITDDSGGTPAGSPGARIVPAVTDVASAANAIATLAAYCAELAAELNGLRARLRDAGLMAEA